MPHTYEVCPNCQGPVDMQLCYCSDPLQYRCSKCYSFYTYEELVGKEQLKMNYAKYKWLVEEVEHIELSAFLNDAEETGNEVFSIISQNTHSVIVILRRSNKTTCSR